MVWHTLDDGKYWLCTLLRVREALDMSSLLVRQEHNRDELRQQCGVLRYERVLGFFVAFSSTNLDCFSGSTWDPLDPSAFPFLGVLLDGHVSGVCC
jgi:hypothetical protein